MAVEGLRSIEKNRLPPKKEQTGSLLDLAENKKNHARSEIELTSAKKQSAMATIIILLRYPTDRSMIPAVGQELVAHNYLRRSRQVLEL